MKMQLRLCACIMMLDDVKGIRFLENAMATTVQDAVLFPGYDK